MAESWLPFDISTAPIEDLIKARGDAIADRNTLEAAFADFEIAKALHARREFSAALPAVDAAAKRFEQNDDQVSAARCKALRGIILIAQGRHDSATRELDAAWLQLLELGAEIEVGSFDFAWARCLLGSGDYKDALGRFISSLDAAIENKDSVLASESSMAIGEVLSLLGRQSEAVQFVDGACVGYRALGRLLSAAKADEFCAHILVSLGKRKAAVIKYEAAFEGYVTSEKDREATECARLLGRLLADIGTRDMDADASRAALENLQTALAGFEILGMEASVAGTQRDIAETLVDLGAIELELSHLQKALPHFESAIKNFASAKQPLSATAAARRLAYALELLDLPPNAEEILHDALSDTESYTVS